MTLRDWTEHVSAARGHVPARHHRLLVDHLTALAERQIDRLLVMMPPGSAKSTYASMYFPCWWLLNRPTDRVIAASHTESLATYNGRHVRALLTEFGPQAGIALARDDRSAVRFSTQTGGSYFGTGVRGPLAGRRGELVVIDDPVKTWAEADSAANRDALWDWFRADLATRLSPRGVIAMVMTRWHEDDLAGRLMEVGDRWTQLCLPALAEDAGDVLGRAVGEPLWPENEDAAALQTRRHDVGPRVWSALYQQRPRSDTEALFHVERIGVLDAAPECHRVVRAWDLAATAVGTARDPDWTVGLKLGALRNGGLVILDIVRMRGGPHEVADTIVQTARVDGGSVVVGLPQDPGQAGKQQVAWLSGLLQGIRVQASPETGSKLTRAVPASAAVDAGRVAMVRGAWNRELLEELRCFPSGRKDDQVDALSRAVAMLAERPSRRVEMSLLAR